MARTMVAPTRGRCDCGAAGVWVTFDAAPRLGGWALVWCARCIDDVRDEIAARRVGLPLDVASVNCAACGGPCAPGESLCPCAETDPRPSTLDPDAGWQDGGL